VNFLELGGTILATTQRTAPNEVWNASASISLQCLLEPGMSLQTKQYPLKKGIIPSRETFEAALASATSNDEKKKAQAALNDYDNLLTRTAGHAAVLVSSSTELVVSVCIINGALIPRPPTPIEPTLTIPQLIPPRAPLPAFPKRDASNELRKEIEKIICTILMQYDQLFCQQDIQVGKIYKSILISCILT